MSSQANYGGKRNRINFTGNRCVNQMELIAFG